MRFHQFSENSAMDDTVEIMKKSFSPERKAVQAEVLELVRAVQMGKGDKMELAMKLTALTKRELEAKRNDPDLKISVDQNIGMMKRAMDKLTGVTESVGEIAELTEVANESIDVFDFFYNDTDSIEDIKNYNWDSVSDKEIEDLENFAYTMYRGSRDDDSLGEYFSTASNFLDNLLAQRKGNVSESLESLTEAQFDEAAGEKDACYRKVKSRYKVWPSAYASGALVKCRKVGAANWGNSKKK